MISNMTSVTLAQKMYVPLLLWTLVARVVKNGRAAESELPDKML
jgi:hypothetical protein